MDGSAEPHNEWWGLLFYLHVPIPLGDKVRRARQQHSPLSTAEGSGDLNAVHTPASLEGLGGSSWVCGQGSCSGGWAWPSDTRD